jgi:hypothetical protein
VQYKAKYQFALQQINLIASIFSKVAELANKKERRCRRDATD